jgi:predicted ribosomally synthesized peptide with SipW-like signal peptide
MEWAMTVSKFLGAGLLTLAVVGGTYSYLNSTLKTATPIRYNTYATQQVQHAGHQPVVTVTEARAS